MKLGNTLTLITSIAVFSCNTEKPISGIVLENIDQAIRQQDDFYQFVNGTWLNNTKIPDDKSSYDSFMILYEEVEKQIKEIIEGTHLISADKNIDEDKGFSCYKSYMDSARIEEFGIKSLEKELQICLNFMKHLMLY